MPEQKRRIGRPRLYDNPEDLERAINEYLETTEEPTMSGLQVHVGMSKQSWSDYGARDGFSDLIQAARLAIESVVEHRVLYASNTSGPIFWMRVHGGYVDKHEIHGPGGGAIPVYLTQDEMALG